MSDDLKNSTTMEGVWSFAITTELLTILETPAWFYIDFSYICSHIKKKLDQVNYGRHDGRPNPSIAKDLIA
jgi:hypothetical protein